MNFVNSHMMFIGAFVAAVVALSLLMALFFRVVVPTNAVHIVQSGKKTTSYGKDMGGNTYYKWPSWVPHFGVRVSILPLSVFRVELDLHDQHQCETSFMPYSV